MIDYREEQKIKSPLVIALVIFSFAAALAGMIILVSEIVREGQSIYEAILIPLITMLAFVFAYFLVFQTMLETDVSQEGFGYRYYPILPKRKVIDFNTVVSWEIKKAKLFSEMGGFGFKKAMFSKKTGYIMHLNDQIEFLLKDGKWKIFSIENTEMMRSRLKKYIGEKEIK